MEAATAAKVASDAAQTAIENLATLQTGETSRDLAHAAYMQSKAAADAAAEAQTASDDAAEATDGVAATRLLVMAETARDNAVEAKGIAETQGAAAMAAAMAELMIVSTVKTVGGTDLDAAAGSSVVKTGEGAAEQTVHTGLIKSMNPDTTGDATPVVVGMDEDEDTPTAEFKTHVAGAAARTFDIGKVVDSTDDTARLLIIDQYAGTKTVDVYDSTTTLDALVVTRASNGALTDADDAPITLKSAGMRYLASELNMERTEDTEGTEVAETAKPNQVYSYRFNTAEDGATPVYVNRYVVLGSTGTVEATATVPAVTTVTYNHVVIHVSLDHDGDEGTVDNIGTVNKNFEVTAKIPEATDYDHIHFGVWAALGAAAKNGTQKLSELGFGFVQNFSGVGLTSIGGTSDDMPNSGVGTYNGNWAAAVQAADDEGNGDITLEHDAATLTADFGKGDFTAVLTGLATLTGDIDGNTFSGDEAKLLNDAAETGEAADLLGADGKFTGSFSGGFYGAKAVEAGGIFDFATDGNKDGAFRGAFGGKD